MCMCDVMANPPTPTHSRIIKADFKYFPCIYQKCPEEQKNEIESPQEIIIIIIIIVCFSLL